MHDKIEAAETFVRSELEKDSSGHDWHHIDRVRKNARLIWENENKGDWFVIELAALLHDIPDGKLNGTEEAGWKKLDSFLARLELDPGSTNRIRKCIETVSFKAGKNLEPATIEAEIVQDADRLDALGAIGIARTFAYGGSKGHPIFVPGLSARKEMTLEEYRSGESSSINHFYEKLLKLKDKMNTEYAKQLAEERHLFMERFLAQFYSEWNGKA